MNNDEFRTWSHRTADWAADYRANLDGLRVRAPLEPGATARQLPAVAPELPEKMETVFADFERIIMPGITHWQHPRFFAYFPSNAPPPSVIAEQLVAAINTQCLLWQASPSATELETRTLEWLRQAFGLPATFTGVLNDTASSSTFSAVLTLRERALNWAGNSKGLSGQSRLRVYASEEVHTSVDKAVWMAGIGIENFVRIPVHGPLRSMQRDALERAIEEDKKAGYVPAGIIACVGGTSVGGTDNLEEVCAVARKHNLYVHVDAAWAGSAMICPEFRHLWAGIDEVDSVVINGHKWLGAQIECSILFVKNTEHLLKTLSIRPEYLNTHGAEDVINYSEWSPVLGRRFRALKIWFLLRCFGLEGVRAVIRNHVLWAGQLAKRLRNAADFAITTDPMLSLFSFRHEPKGVADLDAHNLHLVKAINDDGRIYLTQSKLERKSIIRFQCGSYEMQASDVDVAYTAITEVARKLAS